MKGIVKNLGSMFLLYELFRQKKETKKETKNDFTEFYGIISVKHAIPGRVRFSIPILKNTPDLAKYLEDNMKRINGIKNAQAGIETGSFLLEYNEKLEVHMVVPVLLKLMNIDEKAFDSKESLLGKEAKNIIKIFDTALLAKTKGMVSMDFILPALLVGTALTVLYKNPRVSINPYTFLYWAYQRLRGEN